MDPIVIAAVVALVGTLATGILGYFQARSNARNMKTNEGMRAGEYLELISANVIELKEGAVALDSRVTTLEEAIHLEGAQTRKNTKDRAAEIRAGQ